MQRLIQDKLKISLAEEMLFGKLEYGGTARVDVKSGEILVEVIKTLGNPEADNSREGGTKKLTPESVSYEQQLSS